MDIRYKGTILRVLNKLKTRLNKTAGHVQDFDPEFYKSYYREKLTPLTKEDLLLHYVKHGRRQGFHPNQRNLIKSLVNKFGDLPPNFSPEEYRLLNSDLHHLRNEWDLIEHYLVFGKGENRITQAGSLLLADFDANFYRKYYHDRFAFGPEDDLRTHFITNGIQQGLFPNAQTFIDSLQAIYGSLPNDFSSSEYFLLNSDLHSFSDEWALAEHYLVHGRAENRKYKIDNNHLQSEYLRFVKSAEKRALFPESNFFPDTFDDLNSSANLISNIWVSKFNLYEFRILNADWLPNVPFSRMAGMCLFVKFGINRLAPLAINDKFDPNFYRQTAGLRLSGSSDIDLYLDWINRGIGLGLSCNEKAAVTRILGINRFPSCFDDAHYIELLKAESEQLPEGKFNTLLHYVTRGFLRFGTGPLNGDDDHVLLRAIGNYYFSIGDFQTSIKAISFAIAISPSTTLYHQRGECYAALGNIELASEDFESACGMPSASVLSQVKALEYLSQKTARLDDAIARINLSAAECYGSPTWRLMSFAVVERLFDSIQEEAFVLYKHGLREQADSLLTQNLLKIIHLTSLINPLPAKIARRENGHILIIANRDLPQCDYYRVQQRELQLLSGGWKVEILDQNDISWSLSAIDRASAVIFYRVPATPKILRSILYARALGALTFYDIDDLIFDRKYYPEALRTYEGLIDENEYFRLQMGVPLFRFAMEHCDIGLTSTRTLAKYIKEIVVEKKCHVISNGLDCRNERFLAMPKNRFSHANPTIFYGSGTKAHSEDFSNILAPALIEIMRENHSVRFLVAGYVPLDDRFDPFRDRIIQLEFTKDLNAYWEVLSGCDINTAVLSNSVVTDAKSEIKWLEAAVFGVPSVVSPTTTYRDVLVDGETVIFAHTSDDWAKAFRHLLLDAQRAEAIGARAKKLAQEKYSELNAVQVLRNILPAPNSRDEKSLNHPSEVHNFGDRPTSIVNNGYLKTISLAPRLRILIVNVYFPPHTFGGATRVVRDNVDYLIDNMSDHFEIAILAVDHNNATAYQTRVDAYRGIPVFRIATPIEENMDWRPFNDRIKDPFEILMDQFRPDLVHFHCIQRLTASIVEVVLEKRVPYIVTCHDAWWISDYQFLLNEDGEVCTPSPDPFDERFSRAHKSMTSVSRARRLKRLLNDASNVLCVSDSFSLIYRQAGVEKAESLPNGVPSLKIRPPRVTSPNGRVRLGHIGGRTTHKGATLVEVILSRNNFSNLELVIVDHSLNSDESRTETWGNTIVEIIGFVPQDDISQLYAKLDVLLAPSLWPESFGLVTREAVDCGLWVIASDRGAIGEDIVHGINGFVVDVSGVEDLERTLNEINSKPEKYLFSPNNPHHTRRSSSEQSAEIVNLYFGHWTE